jgi:mRNA-degrading endonuclease toxin of MazEF toxin-antitoxin module
MDEILTIPTSSLAQQITTLSPEKMAEVDRAILFALGVRV